MDKISNGIPTGRTYKDRKARYDIITRFYRQWRRQHPSQRVYNVHLRDYINVRSVSAKETAEKASLRHRSTLAALRLDTVLAQARKVAVMPIKPGNKRQGAFKEIIITEHTLPGIGRVKLTVGVKRSDKSKVQYCITALDAR